MRRGADVEAGFVFRLPVGVEFRVGGSGVGGSLFEQDVEDRFGEARLGVSGFVAMVGVSGHDCSSHVSASRNACAAFFFPRLLSSAATAARTAAITASSSFRSQAKSRELAGPVVRKEDRHQHALTYRASRRLASLRAASRDAR